MENKGEYRRDWFVGPIHIIRYRLTQDKFFGVMAYKSRGYPMDFELYFGKWMLVFRRREY
jgi:hypothetical protein